LSSLPKNKEPVPSAQGSGSEFSRYDSCRGTLLHTDSKVLSALSGNAKTDLLSTRLSVISKKDDSKASETKKSGCVI
jgi:hypothetical protein